MFATAFWSAAVLCRFWWRDQPFRSAPKRLDRHFAIGIFRVMKFFLPLLVWLVMATLITAGILVAVAGKGVWLLVLCVVGFIAMVGKYGCLSH